MRLLLLWKHVSTEMGDPVTSQRMEAFSDGVLAIVITIMVLKLELPVDLDISSLYLTAPTLLAYALSYIYVGIYWANHHHLAGVSKNYFWIHFVKEFTLAFLDNTHPGGHRMGRNSSFCAHAGHVLWRHSIHVLGDVPFPPTRHRSTFESWRFRIAGMGSWSKRENFNYCLFDCYNHRSFHTCRVLYHLCRYCSHLAHPRYTPWKTFRRKLRIKLDKRAPRRRPIWAIVD